MAKTLTPQKVRQPGLSRELSSSKPRRKRAAGARHHNPNPYTDYTCPDGTVIQARKDADGIYRTPAGYYAPGQGGNLPGSKARLVIRKAKIAEGAATAAAVASVLSGERRSWAQAQCHSCQSPHRAEIERLRSKGMSYRRLSAYLLSHYQEVISDKSLRHHLMNHVEIAGIIIDRLARDEAITAAVDQETSDMKRLEGMIERLSRAEKALSAMVTEAAAQGQSVPMATASTYQTATQSLRQAISLRDSLLGGRPQDAVDELLSLLIEDGPSPGGRVQLPEEEAPKKTKRHPLPREDREELAEAT